MAFPSVVFLAAFTAAISAQILPESANEMRVIFPHPSIAIRLIQCLGTNLDSPFEDLFGMVPLESGWTDASAGSFEASLVSSVVDVMKRDSAMDFSFASRVVSGCLERVAGANGRTYGDRLNVLLRRSMGSASVRSTASARAAADGREPGQSTRNRLQRNRELDSEASSAAYNRGSVDESGVDSDRHYEAVAPAGRNMRIGDSKTPVPFTGSPSELGTPKTDRSRLQNDSELSDLLDLISSQRNSKNPSDSVTSRISKASSSSQVSPGIQGNAVESDPRTISTLASTNSLTDAKTESSSGTDETLVSLKQGNPSSESISLSKSSFLDMFKLPFIKAKKDASEEVASTSVDTSIIKGKSASKSESSAATSSSTSVAKTNSSGSSSTGESITGPTSETDSVSSGSSKSVSAESSDEKGETKSSISKEVEIHKTEIPLGKEDSSKDENLPDGLESELKQIERLLKSEVGETNGSSDITSSAKDDSSNKTRPSEIGIKEVERSIGDGNVVPSDPKSMFISQLEEAMVTSTVLKSSLTRLDAHPLEESDLYSLVFNSAQWAGVLDARLVAERLSKADMGALSLSRYLQGSAAAVAEMLASRNILTQKNVRALSRLYVNRIELALQMEEVEVQREFYQVLADVNQQYLSLLGVLESEMMEFSQYFGKEILFASVGGEQTSSIKKLSDILKTTKSSSKETESAAFSDSASASETSLSSTSAQSSTSDSSIKKSSDILQTKNLSNESKSAASSNAASVSENSPSTSAVATASADATSSASESSSKETKSAAPSIDASGTETSETSSSVAAATSSADAKSSAASSSKISSEETKNSTSSASEDASTASTTSVSESSSSNVAISSSSKSSSDSLTSTSAASAVIETAVSSSDANENLSVASFVDAFSKVFMTSSFLKQLFDKIATVPESTVSDTVFRVMFEVGVEAELPESASSSMARVVSDALKVFDFISSPDFRTVLSKSVGRFLNDLGLLSVTTSEYLAAGLVKSLEAEAKNSTLENAASFTRATTVGILKFFKSFDISADEINSKFTNYFVEELGDLKSAKTNTKGDSSKNALGSLIDSNLDKIEQNSIAKGEKRTNVVEIFSSEASSSVTKVYSSLEFFEEVSETKISNSLARRTLLKALESNNDILNFSDVESIMKIITTFFKGSSQDLSFSSLVRILGNTIGHVLYESKVLTLENYKELSRAFTDCISKRVGVLKLTNASSYVYSLMHGTIDFLHSQKISDVKSFLKVATVFNSQYQSFHNVSVTEVEASEQSVSNVISQRESSSRLEESQSNFSSATSIESFKSTFKASLLEATLSSESLAKTVRSDATLSSLTEEFRTSLANHSKLLNLTDPDAASDITSATFRDFPDSVPYVTLIQACTESLAQHLLQKALLTQEVADRVSGEYASAFAGAEATARALFDTTFQILESFGISGVADLRHVATLINSHFHSEYSLDPEVLATSSDFVKLLLVASPDILTSGVLFSDAASARVSAMSSFVASSLALGDEGGVDAVTFLRAIMSLVSRVTKNSPDLPFGQALVEALLESNLALVRVVNSSGVRSVDLSKSSGVTAVLRKALRNWIRD